MELASYIKKLLYNHDIVILPGLGALITQYKPAEINSNDLSIAPPSKFVIFDKDKTESDGLLYNYIASQKSISKSEAELFVHNEIDLINKRLNENETILFEGIGYFSKEGSTLRFEREPGANFLTDSFGLSSIDYKPVEYKLTPKQNPEIPQSTEKKSKTHIWVLASIAVLTGLAVTGYFFYPEIANVFTARKKSAPVAVIPSKASNKNLDPKSDTLKKDTIQASSDLEKFFDSSTDKKKALSLSSDPKASKPKANVTYYIIAGSFKTYDRAEVQAKSLTKEGFKPEIIQFEQDKYRVSLGEFQDKAEAQIQLDKIIAKKGADAVWLLPK